MEDQPGALWLQGDVVTLCQFGKPGHEALPVGNHRRRVCFAECQHLIETPLRRRKAQGVAIQRARVNHFAADDFLECAFLADQRGERQPATDGLAQDRQVRHEAEKLLCAARAEAEARDRLVRNHEHALAVAQLADRLDHALHRFHAAGVAEHGLENYGRNLAAILLHPATQMFRIIPARDHELIEHLRNHALAGMQPRGLLVRAPLVRRRRKTDQALIRPAVVMALELEHQPPSRVCPRQAQRGKHDLGRGVVEPHPLRPGNHALQAFRHLDLQLALRGPMHTELRLGRDGCRLSHRRVPVEDRPLANLEINVFVAVHIEEPAALPVREIQRHWLLHLADAAVHAPGDAALGAFVEAAGVGKSVTHDWRRAVVFSRASGEHAPLGKQMLLAATPALASTSTGFVILPSSA